MRYERKYRTETLDIAAVRQLVRSHPMSFRQLHPDRQINNIYFDTPELHLLQENLQGIAVRRKYRLRWYGSDLHQAIDPVLELKAKEGELGQKFLAPVPSLVLADTQALRERLRDGIAQLHAQHPTPGQFAHGDLVPVVLNTYRRAYLASYDGRFRLTIDWGMRHHAFNARWAPLPNPCEDEAVVIEVKYAAADDGDYQRVGQRLPLRLSRNSKYSIGMMLLGHV